MSDTVRNLLLGLPIAATLFLVLEAWVWPAFLTAMCQSILKCSI